MIKAAQTEDIAEKFKEDWIYTNEHSTEAYESSRTLSPSSMQCARMMACKFLGVQKDETKTSHTLNTICYIGTEVHEYIQKNCLNMKKFEYVDVAKYVADNNIDLEVGKKSNFDEGVYETHLYKLDKNGRKIVSFLCDGIIRDKESGRYYILEIKTTGAGGFFRQDGVLLKHYAQGTAYSILLGIPTVLFFYICRDIPNIKTFSFTPTKEDKQALIDMCKEVIEKADNNLVVAKPFTNNKVCAYCNYKSFCRDIGEGEHEYKPKE